MGKIILGVCGFIGSGKGTLGEVLVRDYGFVQDSFAKSLKDACANVFNWPRHLLEGDTKESREWREKVDDWWSEKLERKDFSPRLALQLVGTEVFRQNLHDDLWINTVARRFEFNNQDVVITDVRFPNEFRIIRDYGGKIIRITRGPNPEWYDAAKAGEMEKYYPDVHSSEWAWVPCEPDYTIDNNRTLQYYEGEIHTMMKENHVRKI